jgi:hypothetical protein
MSLRVGADALPVERGLREPPLARVELAFAREEPFAEEELRPFQAAALAEVVLAGDEDVLDEVRVLHEIAVARAGPEAHDVPRILARDAGEELERIAPEGQELAQNGRALRAGGNGGRTHLTGSLLHALCFPVLVDETP